MKRRKQESKDLLGLLLFIIYNLSKPSEASFPCGIDGDVINVQLNHNEDICLYVNATNNRFSCHFANGKNDCSGNYRQDRLCTEAITHASYKSGKLRFPVNLSKTNCTKIYFMRLHYDDKNKPLICELPCSLFQANSTIVSPTLPSSALPTTISDSPTPSSATTNSMTVSAPTSQSSALLTTVPGSTRSPTTSSDTTNSTTVSSPSSALPLTTMPDSHTTSSATSENSHGLALHIVLPAIGSLAVVIVIIAVCLYCRYDRKHKRGIKLPNIEEISAV